MYSQLCLQIGYSQQPDRLGSADESLRLRVFAIPHRQHASKCLRAHRRLRRVTKNNSNVRGILGGERVAERRREQETSALPAKPSNQQAVFSPLAISSCQRPQFCLTE